MLLLLAALQTVYITNAQQDGAVRLVNGGIATCGRVEVFHDGEWGTVCDDRWSSANGNIVCKQLGYEGTEKIFYTAHFGRGKGPIWMDSVECSGRQNSLAGCNHNGWGVHDCSHAEDAGVCCKRTQVEKPDSLPVRLNCPECNVGGSCKACPDKTHPDPTDCLPQVAVRGIVEVQVNGVWGPISAEEWGRNEATVTCGQLGYPMAYFRGASPSMEELWPNYASKSYNESHSRSNALESTASLRSSLSNTILQGIDCSGKESSLLDCYIAGVGLQSNPSQAVATVQCGFFPNSKCYGSSFSEVNTYYQLWIQYNMYAYTRLP